MDGLLQGIKLGVTKNKEVQKELDSNEESFMTDIQREGHKKRRFAKREFSEASEDFSSLEIF